MNLHFFRSVIFFSGYVLLTVTYGSLSIFVWILPARTRHRVISSWTTLVIAWVRIACGVKYHLVGKENFEKTRKPTVVLSKHQSAWETLFLQSIFWPSSTVLKKELLRIPFFGWGLHALSPIAIDRSNPKRALKQVKTKGQDRIEKGLNVILFPEGTRMKPGQRGNYARSGADIACSMGTDVVPIAHNAGKCWPSDSFVKYPGTIIVSIGPAINTENKSSKSVIKEAEHWIESEMLKLDSYQIN